MTRQKKVLYNVFSTCFETFLCPYHYVFRISPERIPMVFSRSRQFWCTKSFYSATYHVCPNIFLGDTKQFAWVFCPRCIFMSLQYLWSNVAFLSNFWHKTIMLCFKPFNGGKNHNISEHLIRGCDPCDEQVKKKDLSQPFILK